MTTTGLRHLSTEERDVEPTTVSLSTGSVMQHATSDLARLNPIPTPIVDLLWGGTSFTYEARMHVARVIMENINEQMVAPVSLKLYLVGAFY
jgi:hypothetical protein